MNHIVIGTAGHVDHGKTCLVNALTGIDTDRLAEEKRRGITIDLGFAYLTLPNGARAGIIDVPGHEKFIRNMLAGAGGIDLALLVVAADEGVMPQTREHLGILSLLGIRRGCVALTKVDLVEPAWLELVKADVLEALVGTSLAGAPILPVSAYTGEGLEELRTTLFTLIEQTRAKRTDRPFRMSVDRVFTMQGFGTVATGTLTEGTLSVGEDVTLYPAARSLKVRGLQVHAEAVETAYAGQRVAVNLQGVKREEIARGDTLAFPGSLRAGMMADVTLRLLSDAGREVKNGSRLHFYCGAKETLCKCVLLGGRETLLPGESCFAQLRFEEPLALKAGDRFVVRFYSPIETIGGGGVLDPLPPKHRHTDPEVPSTLAALSQGDDTAALATLVRAQGERYTPLAQLMLQSALSEADFVRCIKTLVAEGTLISVSERLVIHAALYRTLCERAAGLLQELHKSDPLRAGMRRETLRASLFPRLDSAHGEAILARMLADGVFCAQGRTFALPGFAVRFTPEQQVLRDEFMAACNADPFAPPERAALLAGKRKDAPQVLDALVESGALVPVETMLFTQTAMQRAEEALRDLCAADGTVTLAQFRDALNTSRKYAMALLEYFDLCGITQKQGDVRVLKETNQ